MYQIAASDVDFFKSGFGYLRHLEDDEDYPPRFSIEVNGSSATKADVLQVIFKGAMDELQIEKPLPMLQNQLSGIMKQLYVYTVASRSLQAC